MTKRLMALLVLVSVMSGVRCQVHAAPALQVPPGAIALSVEGGIAGVHDSVIVKVDGSVVVSSRAGQRAARPLTKSERAALVQAFETSGFFQWNASYGGPLVPDGQTRTLYFDDGKRKKSVSWKDPGAPPAGFEALMKRLQAIGRR